MRASDFGQGHAGPTGRYTNSLPYVSPVQDNFKALSLFATLLHDLSMLHL